MFTDWFLNLVPFLPVLGVLIRKPTAALLMLAASLGFALAAIAQYLLVRLDHTDHWSTTFFDPKGADPNSHQAALQFTSTPLIFAAVAGILAAALWIKQTRDQDDRRLTLLATSLILAAMGLSLLSTLWTELGANPLDRTERFIWSMQKLNGIIDTALIAGLLLLALSLALLPLYRLTRRALA